MFVKTTHDSLCQSWVFQRIAYTIIVVQVMNVFVCLFVTLVGPGVREQWYDECGRDDVSDRRGDGRYLLRLLLRQVRESSSTHTLLVVSCVYTVSHTVCSLL